MKVRFTPEADEQADAERLDALPGRVQAEELH
jgi:hypothetical protein